MLYKKRVSTCVIERETNIYKQTGLYISLFGTYVHDRKIKVMNFDIYIYGRNKIKPIGGGEEIAVICHIEILLHGLVLINIENALQNYQTQYHEAKSFLTLINFNSRKMDKRSGVGGPPSV